MMRYHLSYVLLGCMCNWSKFSGFLKSKIKTFGKLKIKKTLCIKSYIILFYLLIIILYILIIFIPNLHIFEIIIVICHYYIILMTELLS